MKLDLNVSRKTFENDNGEKIPYIAYEIELGGQKFSLVPRSDDKKLLTYLINQEEQKNASAPVDMELESLASLGVPPEKGGKR